MKQITDSGMTLDNPVMTVEQVLSNPISNLHPLDGLHWPSFTHPIALGAPMPVSHQVTLWNRLTALAGPVNQVFRFRG